MPTEKLTGEVTVLLAVGLHWAMPTAVFGAAQVGKFPVVVFSRVMIGVFFDVGAAKTRSALMSRLPRSPKTEGMMDVALKTGVSDPNSLFPLPDRMVILVAFCPPHSVSENAISGIPSPLKSAMATGFGPGLPQTAQRSVGIWANCIALFGAP